uniref:C-type lectin domain containing 16A n=1 Tax=Eptatretus burgeri TaxID=7764 RepID=A0A8C4QRE3_EPTBU
MFGRQRGWVGSSLRVPKKFHSLDHLKYLYHVLTRNTTVTEGNRNLLVETIRSISEILIWGDQNDSTVFDYFLEKNMFIFFLNILRQKSGRYVCVQLLQTLNILFENISHETSLYYLLSNNHVNSIIIHKFDFSDEEIMAYYISFLKTLSLKLNAHTVHFFYNENTNDFALYTEAIKFFNHPESMVRIAVRTLTLNVYKAAVNNKAMLQFVWDRTAAPYFSNLVWFIGNHVMELDKCVCSDIEHKNRGRLSDLVAEHLDHLHYLNDILTINCEFLNEVLTDHLLNRLFLPLYVYSLIDWNPQQCAGCLQISSGVSLYLLSQVFLIISYSPLVNMLADVIVNGDLGVFVSEADSSRVSAVSGLSVRRFTPPTEPLEKSLELTREGMKRRPGKRPNYKNVGEEGGDEETASEGKCQNDEGEVEEKEKGGPEEPARASEDVYGLDGASAQGDFVSGKQKREEIEMVEMDNAPLWSFSAQVEQNITDEEKSAVAINKSNPQSRPFLKAVYTALLCEDSDSSSLFVLCLLYAMQHNKGMDTNILDKVRIWSNQKREQASQPQPEEHQDPPGGHLEKETEYNQLLVERLISILSKATLPESHVRLGTLELACMLLQNLGLASPQAGGRCVFRDVHCACIEGARQDSITLLRGFYKNKPLNVEFLSMDASILLPPTGTPLTGITFTNRLPCGDAERARRAMRVFFLLRVLSLNLSLEREMQLPLTRDEDLIKSEDVLDLNNSDLLSCVVCGRDAVRLRRFLVVDIYQMLLVEPDAKRLGWGVVRFSGLLQDLQVTGDKDDHRVLHVTIHRPASTPHARPLPVLQAAFEFDDHIRCMAAKQRLAKGRLRARHIKMQRITALLELPIQPSPELIGMVGRSSSGPAYLSFNHPFRFIEGARRGLSSTSNATSSSTDRVPGFAVARRESPVYPTGNHQGDISGHSSTASSENEFDGAVGGADKSAQTVQDVTTDSGPPASTSEDSTPPSSMTHHTLRHTNISSRSALEGGLLAPSLMPAAQPVLSLLPSGNEDSPNIESLTILPPADAQRIRSLSGSTNADT